MAMGRKNSPAGMAIEQFRNADNMTDQFGALAALAQTDCPEREQALAGSTGAGSTKRWSSINGCGNQRPF